MQPSALAKRLYIITFIIVIAVYFFGLGYLPLLGPDEPRYAQVAREMLLRGDPITPTLGGHTWFEKPPLLYWLMIAAAKVFGMNEWSARFGPAMCGLLTVAAVLWVGRETERAQGVADFGLRAALVTASCLGLIVFSRAASFDVVITMTATWSLAFFLMHELAGSRRRKTWLLIGFFVFVGLSLLAKGLVGVVIPFGVVGLYYLLRRKWPERHVFVSLVWGLPLAALVAATWYGPVIAKHGWTFVDEFFIQHHFARYTSNKYKHPQPIYFFPAIILMLTLPWTGFLIDALARVRSWTWRGDDSLSIVRVFSLAWLLLPIVFFSFSGSKLPGYVLPAVPAAALLITDRLRSPSKWTLRVTGAICFILGVGGIVYAAQTSQVSLSCAVLAAAPMIVAAFAALFMRADTAAQSVAGGIFVLIVVLVTCAAPPIAHRESVRDLLKLADARGYGDVPVLAQRNDDRSPQFYAHDRVVYNDEGEVVTFDEVTVDKARALGRRLLVLIPVEYVDHFRNARGIEVIGDNGRTAILGWTPP
ncbi:MAG TPA: glycosyltransferase family 39 protein [Pyrinomonadaceae bacterium]|nr:glycosyltransferase family 39 protein [Pyrinomonadaceae bacterium]